ncbi:hypothetical protein LX64_01437 [Chitinophaga skermanii]|uniref:Uncharacterized protein n=1 Tax=Chitinophaga skermanii TaxID=331697 RepID=A0A327QZC0_9BACT|nr:hypothetical protein [Chitinophaga skermanii]RAJ08783.1 hypothetical protein LX64_01437 [Chitinophaga skermanii]
MSISVMGDAAVNCGLMRQTETHLYGSSHLDGIHGYRMDSYRNYLSKNGFTNALSFDGSDSALLIRDKTILIQNGDGKDKYTDSGITFRVPVSK